MQDFRVGAVRPFNVAQVRLYCTPETLAHSFFADLGQGVNHFVSPDKDEVFLAEILDRDDTGAHSKQMEEAKCTEIKKLHERVTFKVILREEVPPDVNVLPGRLFLAIKWTED